MLVVIVPLVLLFAIALIKKIPWIGGDIRAALLAAAVSAGLIGGLAPAEWALAIVDGVDRLAWVIALSLFGSIYAEAQVRLGAMETTLFGLRALFGKSPKGLIAAVFVTLILAGSLLGDAIAAATVIGFLVIHALSELRIKPVQIGMMILIGASIGSIMPPISQGVFLSASLVGIDPTPVTNLAYLTVGVGAVFAILESFRFVRAKRGLGRSLVPAVQTAGGRTAGTPSGRAGGAGTPSGRAGDSDGQAGFGSGPAGPDAAPLDATGFKAFAGLMRERWTTLIPLAVLVAIVIAKTGFGFDVFTETPVLSSAVAWMGSVPVLKGIAFPVVLAIIVAILVSFFFKSVRRDSLGTVATGLGKVSGTVQIQLCAAAMIGIFYAVGGDRHRRGGRGIIVGARTQARRSRRHRRDRHADRIPDRGTDRPGHLPRTYPRQPRHGPGQRCLGRLAYCCGRPEHAARRADRVRSLWSRRFRTEHQGGSGQGDDPGLAQFAVLPRRWPAGLVYLTHARRTHAGNVVPAPGGGYRKPADLSVSRPLRNGAQSLGAQGRQGT